MYINYISIAAPTYYDPTSCDPSIDTPTSRDPTTDTPTSWDPTIDTPTYYNPTSCVPTIVDPTYYNPTSGERIITKVICNVSDGAPNQFSDDNGFNGKLMQEQEKYINTSIVGRVHCINHEWDLFDDTASDINELIDIIERSRKYMDKVDVWELMVSVAVVYDIQLKIINKYFNQRWIMHCSLHLIPSLIMISY